MGEDLMFPRFCHFQCICPYQQDKTGQNRIKSDSAYVTMCVVQGV